MYGLEMAMAYRRAMPGFCNRREIVLLILYCSLSVLTFTTATPNITKNKKTSDTVSHNVTEAPVFFQWQDYTVLSAMLIISCIIGVFYGYFGEKQTTGDDFLLGGSSMGTLPMAMSLGASFITAIELLGNPAEMYMAGAQFWMICISFVLVVPITGQLYLPVFMRLRLTSCYEYLELRFCKFIRVYASSLYMMQMILYTAVAVYAPALALSDVAGLNTYIAVSLVYAVCIFYASQGGMKAVIMTDSFQSAVLIGSLAVVLKMSMAHITGFDEVWEYAWQTNRLRFFNMNPDPTIRHSFWSVVIGGTLYWISMFCANQASIQKYLSVERISQAQVALWLSAICLIVVYSVNFVTGAVLAFHYASCDPIQAGVINAADQLLPLFVVHQLGHVHGVPGFFVAGIFAASLGTVASALNSLAAIACQDLATSLLGITLAEDSGAAIARWVCLACGVISFGLVFLVERLGPVLQLAISFNGMAGGVALGLFTLGMFFPWANAKGAVTGGIFGLVVVLIAGGGAQLAQVPVNQVQMSTEGCIEALNSTYNHNEDHDTVFWLFRISYLWYTGLGASGTIVVGLLTSVVTGVTDPAHVPIDLISPPIVKLLNSLPNKFKSALKVPSRLGFERRRNSSMRPSSVTDRKDKRRKRRLSEMASGVFYSDDTTLHRGYDNLAMGLNSEKPPPEEHLNPSGIKLESTADHLPETTF